MSFNIQGWGRLSSNANSHISVLQDGSISGSPSSFSYIHATDDINTITNTNYFGSQAVELDQTDLIYVAASDGIVQLYVVSVDEINKVVQTAIFSGGGGGSGDVSGPGSSTNHGIARYAGTTGKIIANSNVVIDDSNNVSGVQNLEVQNGIDSLSGKGISLWSNGNTYKTTLKGSANVENIIFHYPPDYPTQNGMQLTFDTDGTSYFASPTAAQWIEVSSNITMEAGNGYVTTSGSILHLLLPATAVVGDSIEVRNEGAGGFRITQNANQEIFLGNVSTTTGTSGYIEASITGDAVYLVCIHATDILTIWSCVWTGQIASDTGAINTPGNMPIPLPVNLGGTNATIMTAYGTVYAGVGGGGLTTTSPGTAGQVLTSNGASAAPTYQTISGGGGENFQIVTSAPGTMVQNITYVANSGSLLTFNLPATCAAGQIFGVQGMGTGGWKLQANTGQIIHFNSTDTSSGGYLQSNARYDSAVVFCSVANSEYIVFRSGGAAITVG